MDAISEIEARLGGRQRLAEITRVGSSAISNWRARGGKIPPKHWPAIVSASDGTVTFEHLMQDVGQ